MIVGKTLVTSHHLLHVAAESTKVYVASGESTRVCASNPVPGTLRGSQKGEGQLSALGEPELSSFFLLSSSLSPELFKGARDLRLSGATYAVLFIRKQPNNFVVIISPVSGTTVGLVHN